MLDELRRRSFSFLRRVQNSTIAKNSFVYTLDFGLQIFVQAAYLLMLSRAMGPANFGIFAALSAISIIGSTFVGWGCDQVLIKTVAHKTENFSVGFGNGLLAIGISLPFILPICFWLCLKSLGSGTVSYLSIFSILIADLLFTKLLFLAKACFTAFEQSRPQLVINIAATVVKLLAAVCAVIISPRLEAETWAVWYCVSAAISALLALAVVVRKIGRPRLIILMSEIKVGLLFCSEFASLAALRDIDKPIIVSLLGAEISGYYSVAFRIVDAASTPVRGLLYATYTRYFKHSHESRTGGLEFGLKVLPYAAIFSLFVSLSLFFCAPLLPYLIGKQYAPTVEVVRWLAVYPLLFALIGVSADILRAIGFHAFRVALLILAVPLLMTATSYFAASGKPLSVAMGRDLVMALICTSSWIAIIFYKKRQ